jgi:hypothetical protein
MGSPPEVLSNGMLTREQIAALPKKKYRLLLVLNEHSPTRYDILLNNFFPLRVSDYGSWDAPLLPAFKGLHGLVSGWSMDVRRRLDDYREQVRQGGHVGDDVARLEGILGKLVGMREGDEELVIIATKQFVKFSPTDGIPTLYEYSLTHWPLLSDRDSALRWFLRDNNYVQRLDSGVVGSTDFRNYPRGLVWVPLDSWKKSSAIRARNADVMQWVDETLAGLGKATGATPPWLVLGSGTQIDVGIKDVETKPFGRGTAGREVVAKALQEAPLTLVEGLDSVRTSSKDLYVYRDQEVCTGFLRLNPDCTHGRIGVDVYFRHSDGSEERAGCLRPVQRYVLTQGLRRAQALRKRVNSHLEGERTTEGRIDDIARLGMTGDAGYLRVTVSGVG